MLLLSFDIGIKHLAYSLVEVEDAKLKQVRDWGLVNLIADVLLDNLCMACPVQNTRCRNKASKCIGLKDKKLIFCKNKKCLGWILNEWKQRYPKSKAKPTGWKSKKATSYSLIGIAQSIKRWIESAKEKWRSQGITETDIHRVLLEHQPVFRNPVMKSVEMILVGVCVGTGLHTGIEFVHAGKKTKQSDSYVDRKQMSVDAIETLLENSEVFPESVVEVWKLSYKRDDLADTVNQAVAWSHIHR